MLDTPVAFIIFNRPELTQRVFDVIAQAKPKKLLIVADGPRFTEEVEKCCQARAIIDKVNWDCEVLTNFAETNMGCKCRVSSGLDWVFSQVEEAIILEDDCLPHPSFFPYCVELLDKYRDCDRIVAVTGCNFQDGRNQTPHSYFFSKFLHVWGWASWRRAWKHYDVEMRQWVNLRDTPWLSQFLPNNNSEQYWTDVFDRVSAGAIDTWDYQWLFSCWVLNGLVIQPSVNLISNIGFGEGATHTQAGSIYSCLPVLPMNMPLVHPSTIERNDAADLYTTQHVFITPDRQEHVPFYLRLFRRVKKKFLSSSERVFMSLRDN